MQENKEKDVPETAELVKIRHQLTDTISTRLEAFSLNTVISGFMEFNNKLAKLEGGVDKKTLETYALLLAPFAPHIAAEVWEELGHDSSIFEEKWPVADKAKAADDTKEIGVQVNGKVRGTVEIAVDADKDSALAAAKEAVADKLEGKTIVKEIYVPGKIINIVVR